MRPKTSVKTLHNTLNGKNFFLTKLRNALLFYLVFIALFKGILWIGNKYTSNDTYPIFSLYTSFLIVAVGGLAVVLYAQFGKSKSSLEHMAYLFENQNGNSGDAMKNAREARKNLEEEKKQMVNGIETERKELRKSVKNEKKELMKNIADQKNELMESIEKQKKELRVKEKELKAESRKNKNSVPSERKSLGDAISGIFKKSDESQKFREEKKKLNEKIRKLDDENRELEKKQNEMLAKAARAEKQAAKSDKQAAKPKNESEKGAKEMKKGSFAESISKMFSKSPDAEALKEEKRKLREEKAILREEKEIIKKQKKEIEASMKNIEKEVVKKKGKKRKSMRGLSKLPSSRPQRIEMYRNIAKQIQRENASFTVSDILEVLVQNFNGKIDEDRKTFLKEIEEWVSEDPYTPLLKTENGVKLYRMITK